MSYRRFVAKRLGDRKCRFEAIERGIQIQLGAEGDTNPAEQRRRDRCLLRRAQLRQRLLVQSPRFLRTSLPLGELRTIDERRGRRRGAEQPRLQRMLERVRERLGGVAHSISGRVDEGCTDALAIKCDVSHAHACRRLWKVQQGIRLKTPGCPQRSSGQTGVSTGLARWYSCGTVESADRDDVS